MGARTSGREAALMILFGLDTEALSSGSLGDPELAIRAFYAHVAPETGISPDEEARQYATEIVRGVVADLAQIDDLLRRASTNWRLERMSRVDRNVLRIVAWELRGGAPRAVALDEAVELAKRFGTAESGAFVNGVATRTADELEKK
jgi:N utilization substance protein B